ncbi:hypothetical protein BK411_12535 [Vibrio splendidus]|nr:hypothetical protein BK411_12535 [Vibrio splendidus]
MNFRHDINGLRAIAVIAVAIFHFNSGWLPGGFAGVDVFFVISGFLMTSIIFKGLENNSFSLVDFYIARGNRIIPPLAFLCFILIVFGFFYLSTKDYIQLSKHITSSVTFFSNFFYWHESGYFAQESHEKWLLHTWSLSVEWQFYILYPIILIFLKKFFSVSLVKRIIFVGMIFGFIYSAFVTQIWPDAAYYLLPTRAWEMIAGGVAYIYPLNIKARGKTTIEGLGLLFVFSSFIFVSEKTLWPGYMAILPVVGTYLVIISNRQDSIFTSNRVSQYLGRWSYSIYLWHWPICVLFYQKINIIGYELFGLLLSIVVGFLSYRFIETVRFKKTINFSGLLKSPPLYLSIFTVILGSSIYFKKGYPERFSSDITLNLSNSFSLVIDGEKCHNSTNLESSCWDNRSPAPNILLLGDSHAGTIAAQLYALSDEKGYSYRQFTHGGCTQIDTVVRYNESRFGKEEDTRCTSVSKEVADHLENPISPRYTIVYMVRMPLYLSSERFDNGEGGKESKPKAWVESTTEQNSGEEISSKLRHWNALGHKLILVYPVPEVGWDVTKYAFINNLEPLVYKDKIKKLITTSYSLFKSRTSSSYAVFDAVDGVDVFRVYPEKLFCSSKIECVANSDSKFYYFDDDHLSKHGAKMLVEKISKKI